ncbi:CHAP domain-containing protein [Hyalangium rubrum]|uniref:CHAP domain-containing protein n=1 Tax=Hyalangium rubrum TaxID=3103134 RepID=A0ABU5HEV2_9BACT|nr:CHAP domain-containing protein [Hyalangium sp. s54d21]MDY7231654.1 CHAP domain-containing protein [Hyalangium sp. s54d21]
MRYIALLAGMVWMTGCATGAPPPMGGRMAFEAMRYRPATPSAMPRDIPPEREEPAVAVVQTPPAPAPAPAEARPVVAKREESAAPAPTPATSRAQRPEPKKRAQPAPRPVVSRDARETVLATARGLVGKTQVKAAGRTFPSDCTGLVEAAYAQAGISLRGGAKPGDNGVTALYRYAQAHGRVYTGGRPSAGDLVFFRETYDQNRDGRRNDGLTHVGIVDQVAADGTVTVIHRVSRGVMRYRMNLSKPRVAKDPRSGQVINDTLRAPGPGRTFALTGQLFAAYATVLPTPKAAPVAVARR